jgi:hypothetical protein
MPGFKLNGQDKGPSAQVEPARAHRFSFRFEALKNIALYALSTQRPSVEFDQVKLFHKQTEVYLPAKHRWSPITVKFYELVQGLPGGTTAAQLFSYWAKGKPLIYSRNTLAAGFGKSNVDIDMEDGFGARVHLYKLYGAWPTKVEPSELNYSNTELATVAVTFRYDSAYEDV